MRTIIGICLVAAGLLRLAEILGFIQLGWLWRKPWTAYIEPILMLYIGIELIIFSYNHNPNQWLLRPLPIGEEGKRIRCAVRFGGDEYIYRGETFHGAGLDALCGGIRLDLREAVITEDEEIDIRTFLGGVELLVPHSVNVIVNSRSFIGGVSNDTDRTPKSLAPCIHIIASNFFGGVSIKN